jgi:hypothetical protein
MRIANTNATTNAILALDRGKNKSGACAYDPEGEARFHTLPTARRCRGPGEQGVQRTPKTIRVRLR